jgi:hypothetical protein
MEPADSIERIGFRRWYERQLLEGHAWFVGSFLCLVAAIACAEQLRLDDPLLRQLAFGAGIVAAGLAAIYALLRYLTMLAGALRLGEHATCRACGAYGRFSMVSASRARCRKCANEWRLID